MTKLGQVYKCDLCGNIVEMLHDGAGELVCCEEPMVLLVENTVDASREKHVPVVEKSNGSVVVRVGSVEHPMTNAHYIEWIEVWTRDKIYRKYLNPGDAPRASFLLDQDVLYAKAYCNLHLLWKA